MISTLIGLGIGLISLALGVQGWEIGRLWFYLLSSALLFLAGIQLVIYWLLLRILEELSQTGPPDETRHGFALIIIRNVCIEKGDENDVKYNHQLLMLEAD